MKKVLLIISFIAIMIAALATPLAIGFGLYEWVVVDIEFKMALWTGFKAWAAMLFGGLVIGFPCYVLGQ